MSLDYFLPSASGSLWRAFQARRRAARRHRRQNKRFRKEIGPVSDQNLATAKQIFRLFEPTSAGREMVRLGGNNDGGYLLPDDFKDVSACFSPGVATTIDFDLDMAARGIACFLIDGSVQGLPQDHPLLTFEQLNLGALSGDGVTSLDDWVSCSAPSAGDLILQMDIEGAEFEVLNSVSDDVLRRFRTIVVEFHQFQHVFCLEWRAKVLPGLEKLVRHFAPVHLHPNNHAALLDQQGMRFPRVFEVTFYRRDRLPDQPQPVTLPHPLDQPNVTWLPEYAVPKFWDV
ncbi:FkbM family methyltransferase [uncultured Shimia sp.]|uniref:FkbM family methyltransferase n=1 Tax=uncultured Shimia sp. TaxID=573152 RepID=UPI0026022004|nr:FkbM family methyltransferase [uncultured Shimia sp.]